nr:TIGR00180 family glycosyltransferase [uncultured Desulfobacter sp.]
MFKAAILIPTKNRSDFLSRQLRYYSSVNCMHAIYIGDASDEREKDALEKAIEKYSENLTIHYYHWPDYNDRQTITRLAKVASEKYCCFTGDDDFLIPNSISKCTDFLERNGEYRTAQGKAITIALEDDIVYGAIKGFSPYWQKKESEWRTGKERLQHFSANYWVPQFSVHRTAEFIDDSEHYESMPNKSFGELVHSYTFIIKGKSKFIDCLYLIRQVHNRRYFLPSLIDWITRDDWLESYKLFANSLEMALVKTDNIPLSEAQESVKKAFWNYFSNGVIKNKKNSINLQQIKKQRIKNILEKQIIGKKSLSLAKKVRNYTNGYPRGLFLEQLLLLSSPYYSDFYPVYKLIAHHNQ